MKPWILLVGLILFGTGCQTITYYTQAARGQLQIISGQEEIFDLINDPTKPEKIRQQLNLVSDLREFAKANLGVDPKDNYRRYRDLNRKYVLWVVYAAPKFSTELKSWWYPIVGNMTYRGFFNETDAQSFASKMLDEGMDVHIGGTPAYSTLGWFDDPVLNTFINYREEDLADLIFHELAHHHLFVKGDTTFNESFATAFAQIGVTEWAKAKQNSQALEDYLARRQTKHMVNQLYVQNKIKLKAIYESLKTEEEKREAKKQFIADFRQQLNDMSLSDPRLSKLAILAKRPINNAVLGARAAYHQYVPAFHRLYGESNKEMRIFLDKVQAISKLNKLERDTLLDKYSRQDEMPVKKLLTN